ncbi:MAG: transcription antitermination factor NusB [Pseudomonadota bacterium]
MAAATTTPGRRGTVSRRRAARLAVVQALFQWARSDDAVAEVVRQFREERLGGVIDGLAYPPADEDFFAEVVTGAAARAAEIDALIAAHLAEGWSLGRLDPLVLQILRAGAYELMARPDVPTAVAISEYVEVASAFYDAAEPKFVNGLLDRLAKTLERDARS